MKESNSKVNSEPREPRLLNNLNMYAQAGKNYKSKIALSNPKIRKFYEMLRVLNVNKMFNLWNSETLPGDDEFDHVFG